MCTELISETGFRRPKDIRAVLFQLVRVVATEPATSTSPPIPSSPLTSFHMNSDLRKLSLIGKLREGECCREVARVVTERTEEKVVLIEWDLFKQRASSPFFLPLSNPYDFNPSEATAR